LTLFCATTNPGKLREFRLAIERFGGGLLTVEPLPRLPAIPPCPESGNSFRENAIAKAVYYSAYAPGPLFADDSGLEVDALGGAPGVLSARFAGPGATDGANNRLLLERLRGIENRSARFVCVVALAERGRLMGTFEGVVEGWIADAPRGENGFGYDPLFFYPPFGCTLAEAAPERKLAVSHRGRALAAMVRFLKLSGPSLGGRSAGSS
jgi:XTP/dITP diphosphohydrolase